MADYEAIIKALVEAAMSADKGAAAPAAPAPQAGGLPVIPVGVSNRHLHLSQADQDILFGPGYEMTRIKDLTQPGQFACKETVTIVGPKGALEKVRVLGPTRKATQVELLVGDGFKLGVKAPIKQSGEVEGTPGVTLVGPKGTVVLDKGAMVAKRHIHMTLAEAAMFGLQDGQIVSIEFDTERGGVLNNVVVRANNNSALECHIDTEEANALGVNGKSTFRIIK